MAEQEKRNARMEQILAGGRLVENASDMLAALEAINKEVYICQRCYGTGIQQHGKEAEACPTCGGYGFNPGGDIRQVIVNVRKLIVKVRG